MIVAKSSSFRSIESQEIHLTSCENICMYLCVYMSEGREAHFIVLWPLKSLQTRGINGIMVKDLGSFGIRNEGWNIFTRR